MALAGAGVAAASSPTPRPLPSAPSEYVEVVPTAGGGVSAGSGTRRTSPAKPQGGSSSALGAAADAIGAGDERRLVGLGAVVLATTFVLVVAALRRRQPHVPKG